MASCRRRTIHSGMPYCQTMKQNTTVTYSTKRRLDYNCTLILMINTVESSKGKQAIFARTNPVHIITYLYIYYTAKLFCFCSLFLYTTKDFFLGLCLFLCAFLLKICNFLAQRTDVLLKLHQVLFNRIYSYLMRYLMYRQSEGFVLSFFCHMVNKPEKQTKIHFFKRDTNK